MNCYFRLIHTHRNYSDTFNTAKGCTKYSQNNCSVIVNDMMSTAIEQLKIFSSWMKSNNIDPTMRPPVEL